MASHRDTPDAIHIGGVPIKFPCKPYGSQLSMMAKIIRGIDRRQHCLLESPTGSGKSLALLCSSLGWQRHEYEKQLIALNDEQSVCEDGNTVLPTNLTHCALCARHSKDKISADNIGDSTQDDGHENTAHKIPINVDNGVPATETDDDSDIFQPDHKRFRTPRRMSESNLRKTPGEDSTDNASTSNNISAATNIILGEKSFGLSCNCACHSPVKEDKCKEEAAAEEEHVRKLPRIYFGTRTHKQIAQIIRELKKTAYSNVKMAILGSREHLCVHPEVSRSNNKNDGCRELLDGKNGVSCRYFSNVPKIKQHWQLVDYGLKSAWDVEDLVKLGKKVKSCSYYAARSLAKDADVVFCPYNYLIDPLIRSAMEIGLKGQIIILDEAHNIEDSAREAASLTVRADELQDVIDELDKLIGYKWREEHCRAMHVVVANLQRWITSQSGSLSQNDFSRASKVWSGVEMVAHFSNMGVEPGTFDILKHHLAAVMEDPNPQIPVEQMLALTSASGMLLKGLLIIVDYFFRNNMVYMKDYKVALIKEISQRKWRDNTNNRWLNVRRGNSERLTFSLNFWCMNPAVAFSDVSGEARTIILTSGTLSPMGSFASELGVDFAICLEANHIIKDTQVWVGSIATGPTGKTLNASYKNTETFNFQDDLGRLVLDVCKTIPFGVLCFFSSYSLMQKLSERWKNTGLWGEISEKKIIMAEARGGMKKEFDEQLKEFYGTIEDFETRGIDDQILTGVLFLAVCRGKVSEGMDFADNNARAVITVGIPFPSFKDPQVELKRAYNDQNRDRGLLSGSEWYEIQAYRALNQALGRCLRHSNDWGALILVDERFRRNPQKYINGLSKWVRNKVNHYLYSRDGVESLKNFVTRQQKTFELLDSQKSLTVGSQILHEQSPLLSFGDGSHCSSSPASPATSIPVNVTPLQSHRFARPMAVMHGFSSISMTERPAARDQSGIAHQHTPESTNQFQTPSRRQSHNYPICHSRETVSSSSAGLMNTPVESLLPTMSSASRVEPASTTTPSLKTGSFHSSQNNLNTDSRTPCLVSSPLGVTPEAARTITKGGGVSFIPYSSSAKRDKVSVSKSSQKPSETPKSFKQQTISSFLSQSQSCGGQGLAKKLTFTSKTSLDDSPCEKRVRSSFCFGGRVSPKEEKVTNEEEFIIDRKAVENVKVEEEPPGTPPPLFASEDVVEVSDGDGVDIDCELLPTESMTNCSNSQKLPHTDKTVKEPDPRIEIMSGDQDNCLPAIVLNLSEAEATLLGTEERNTTLAAKEHICIPAAVTPVRRRSERSRLSRSAKSSKKGKTLTRKRSCHEKEEIKEDEDTLVRKSKRSKQSSLLTVLDELEQEPAGVTVFSCASCGTILCDSGIIQVPASELRSSYLLEQLTLSREPARRSSPRKKPMRNDTVLKVCGDGPVNVVPYRAKDVHKLNAHWSAEDDCSFQPVYCPNCVTTQNGSSSAIGYKVVCVGQTNHSLTVGEIWFQNR